MSSPFPPNAVLTFQAVSGFTADPATGNKVPVTTSIAVAAYLKTDSRPRGLFYPGIDEQEEPLTGRAIEALPDGIANLSKAWAVITDPVTGKTQSGYFTLYRGTPSAFGVESVLGPKISGVFRSIALGGTNTPVPQPTPGLYAAAVTLAAHKLVALVNGQLVYANAGDVTQPDGAIGLTLNAVAAGGKPQIAANGTVQDASWSWVANQAVFVGANGAMTQTPLTVAPGYYQPVGIAVSANQVVLNLEAAYLL